jgi:hypothetical protein
MISVYRMADEAVNRRALDVSPGVCVVLDDGARGERLAVWQAGPYGLDWIRQAAGYQGGVALERDGYPHRYLARAADVFATFLNRRPYKAPMYEYPSWVVPEGSVLLPGYLGRTTLEEAALNACADDEWLYIEAWDES